jgi:protein gp37
MGKTPIEWTRGDDGSTGASCNPIVGCTECSPGCANCYAARLASTRLRSTWQYKDLAVIGDGGVPRWNGEVRFLPERLNEPRHWKKPRRIFVCDMGDLFHEKVHDEWIDQVFAMMVDCPQHTFQILTKRAERMRDYLRKVSVDQILQHVRGLGAVLAMGNTLPNVWCGVSVENQHFADERIPLLLETPAAVRWISAEPLLGAVNLKLWCRHREYDDVVCPKCGDVRDRHGQLDWVVCGGESGPNARPMHPDWARSLRDQCQGAGVPFFFKQWGAYAPSDPTLRDSRIVRMGKKKAGRMLDGREWSEFPHGAD